MEKKKKESAERTEIHEVRNVLGEITGYTFKIYKKYEEPFEGELSNEEMEVIKTSYTTRGLNLTQKAVYDQYGNIFSKWSFNQFRQILRAFQITKADAPFTDHDMEMYSNEELEVRLKRIKKSQWNRKVDANRIKDLEKFNAELLTENANLNERLSQVDTWTKAVDSSKTFAKFTPATKASERDIIVYLADMHIGARSDQNDLYYNPYDLDEVRARLEIIYNHLSEQSLLFGGYRKVIIANMGDSLDGMDSQTSRRDHMLPQNMNNQEQTEGFVDVMLEFMTNIVGTIQCKEIEYYAVGSSNHGGDYERSANLILAAYLQGMGVKSTIFDRFMDFFTIDGLSVILCHGKDEKQMKSPMPLHLNPATEVKINDFMTNYEVYNRVVLFVKGDTHVSGMSYGKNFIYKSVGCFVGSTKYCSANYGRTPAVCEYTLYNHEDDSLMDGRIILN